MVSLATGIGGTAAVLTLVVALFASGAAGVDRPQRLVGVYTATAPGSPYGGTSYLNFLDLRSRTQVFEDLTAFYAMALSWLRQDDSGPVQAEAVSGNYFTVLGVAPARGRLLQAEDDRKGAEPAAVVSHAFWKDRLGSPHELGNTRLRLNGTQFTVAGVAPEGFRGASRQSRTEVWFPLAALPRVASGPMPADILEDRGAQWFSIVGRLKDGVGVSLARLDLEGIRSRLEREAGAAAWGRPVTVTDWHEVALGRSPEPSRSLIRLLAFSSVLILLISCGNAANLLIARTLSCRNEIAVRLALGASPLGACRPLVGEAAVLGLSACAGGLAMQQAALRLLLTFGLPLTPFDVRVTSATTLTALAVAGLATLLFSSGPVMTAARKGPLALLKAPGLLSAGRRRFHLGKTLVTVEAGLSMVLLVAALLALASALNVLAIDPGFEAEKVAAAFVDLGAQGYSPEQGGVFYDQILEKIRSRPGVVSASLTTFLPFEGSLAWAVHVPGTSTPAAASQFSLDIVDRDSFKTLGIPLLRGRDFRSEDAASGAVIVSKSLARALWGSEAVLGKTFSLEGPGGKQLPVVGVVADARYSSPTAPPEPHFYLYRRFKDSAGLTSAFSTSLFLLVRAEDEPEHLLPRIREALASAGPALPAPRLVTLRDHVRRLTARSRQTAALLGVLGGAGLLLASGGLSAVMLSSLLARRHELAVQAALGASPRSIFRGGLKEAGLLAMTGILVGTVIALALIRLVESQLYEIKAQEPLVYLAAAALLLAASLAGSLRPVRRAAREDPAAALRSPEG